MKDLIVVKQLPLIEEHLKQLSVDIDKKVETANALICNEDTVKEVKELRATFNKDFKELEQQRKLVKEQVLAPYMAFEDVYKEYVSEKYKSADSTLKTKIDTVENDLKLQKENEIKEYFNECLLEHNIDFITYEQANINVTLSASMKSLKEQAKAFVDKIADDLALIDTQDYKAEILVEYKQSLNVAASITNVKNRFKTIEEEKARQEELAKIKEQEQQNIEKVEKFTAPEVVEIPKENVGVDLGNSESVQIEEYTMTFKVAGTLEQLKSLKQFLIEGGYKYGNE